MKRSWSAWFFPQKRQQRPYLLTSSGFFVLSLSAAFIYLVLLASTHIPGMENVLGYASDITVAEVLSGTNAERSKEGRAQLQLNAQLSQAALAKAQDMLAQGYWAHNTPQGKEPWSFIDSAGYRYQVAGENLARNFSSTDSMVSAWLASPSHRSNLLSDRYSETGIAVLQGEMEGVPTTLVVQMFGAPQRAIADIAPVTETAPPSSVPSVAPTTVNAEEETQEEISDPEPSEVDATAPLARPQGQPNQEVLLGSESQVQTALVSPDNVLTIPQEPILSPATAFRVSIFVLSGVVIFVLASDHSHAKKKKRVLQTAKHLAHIILLCAILLTLALTQTGGLI